MRSPIIEHSNKFLFDEEAVLTVGDGVGTGKVFHYVNGKYDLHQRVYRLFGFSEDTDAKFFYHWFSSHFYDRVMSMTAKTSVDSVRLEMISDMNFVAPGVDEQRKIASCLGYIDSLITLHQCKYYHLRTNDSNKKTELLLLHNPATWEQRKLGDMATFAKGKGYSKSDLCDDGNPIILYGRLYTKYETVISEVDTFAEAKDGSVYSVGGEVIVPASGETAEEISIASVVANSGVLLGGDLNVISPSDSLDPAFLAISITYGNPHNEMAKLAQGKTVVHLHNDDLKKIDLLFPTLEEQRRIRDVFYDIDNIITLHQRNTSL